MKLLVEWHDESIILGGIGLWDDMRNLRPAPRLAIQTAAGLFTAWILISQNTIGNPTNSTIIDALITSFWLFFRQQELHHVDQLILQSAVIQILRIFREVQTMQLLR